MAIRIPSKNIYEMNNPKVRDNIVDKVSVEQKVIGDVKKYKEPVYSTSFDATELTLIDGYEKEQTKTLSWLYKFDYDYFFITGVLGYIRFSNIKCCTLPKIEIPILSNNAYITSVLEGVDASSNANISITLNGKIKKYEIGGQLSFTIKDAKTNGWKEIASFNEEQLTYTLVEDSTSSYSLADQNINTNGFSSLFMDGETLGEFSFTPNVPENIKTITISKNEELDRYTLEGLTVFASAQVDKISTTPNTVSENGVGTAPAILFKDKIRTIYELETIEISLYGNTIGIDLTDGSVTYGSGNKPHSLSGNELLQDSGKVGDTLLTEYLANNALTQYKNGKETATLLCSISDYYDYDTNEKMIDITSSDKMSFKLHDQVIPMVYGADGKDRPMSLYRDGTPKVFQVLGSKIFYDGAVWQELSLQEVTKG